MGILYAAVLDLPLGEARDSAPGTLARLPVLERLLARGERRAATPDWRRWALGLAGLACPAGDLPLGRMLARAHGLGVEAGSTWFVATPVRLSAGMTSVQVVDPRVPLEAHAAAALAERFNADWTGSECRLHAVGGELVLSHAGALAIESVDPARLGGRALAAGLPSGADAPRVRRLMTEIQMWLHALPPAGPPRTFNDLWLWGAGAGEPAGSAAWPGLADVDPYLDATRSVHPGRTRLDSRLVRWSVEAVLAEGHALEAVDRHWFGPLARALADGTTPFAELHVGASVVHLTGAQRRRLWRRPRPWWEFGS